MERLKTVQVAESTRKNYFSVWRSFNKFLIKLDKKPDNWEDRIMLFVTYLIENNKQSQTVKSYISAIKGILAEIKMKINQDQFLLSALTRACKFKNDKASMQMPIRRGMLRVLLAKTDKYYGKQLNQQYLKTLYLALFSTAYFGLFRVGELTSGEHPIKANNVFVGTNKRKMLFILRSSKTHGEYARPQLVKISNTPIEEKGKLTSKTTRMKVDYKDFCPYKLLLKYIALRPIQKSRKEPFFIFKDYSPVQPKHMREALKHMLSLSGFDKDLFNCQSLRIGRASDLLRFGVSVETIKKLGCWKSNAVFTYLRSL